GGGAGTADGRASGPGVADEGDPTREPAGRPSAIGVVDRLACAGRRRSRPPALLRQLSLVRHRELPRAALGPPPRERLGDPQELSVEIDVRLPTNEVPSFGGAAVAPAHR